jgi:hypothetical protein
MRSRENGVEILLHQSAHTLRLDEVVIHGICAQTERAEEDAALYFGAKPVTTRVGV